MLVHCLLQAGDLALLIGDLLHLLVDLSLKAGDLSLLLIDHDLQAGDLFVLLVDRAHLGRVVPLECTHLLGQHADFVAKLFQDSINGCHVNGTA